MMNFKKIIPVLALVLSLISVSVSAKTLQVTMGDNNVKVDDGAITEYALEVAPYTVDGRTMVPIRKIAETFGAKVYYVENENKVVVKLNEKTISIIIGQAVANVDGETVALDVPAVETNGRTLLPLRFVSENLGLDIKYHGSTEQILITDDPAVMTVNGYEVSLTDFKAMYKLNALRYAGMITEEDNVAHTKVLLANYAMYEAESEKLGITIDPSLYHIIRDGAKEFDVVDGVLDASWIGLLEDEYRTMNLVNILNVLYTPEKDTAEKFYNENYFAAKHILVSDEATAKSIASKVKYGGDFDKLMNEYSIDPGLAENPDGYVLTKGEMVEECENATKDLKIGKVSAPVKSDFGYHIIKRMPLPDYSQYAEAIAISYADEKIAEHFNSIAENAEIKDETYTISQLVELCK